MKPKRKQGRRKRRHNPSTHPILAALATMILGGLANALLLALVARAGTKGYAAKAYATVLLTSIGGYFLGKHYFPESKTPILVGSVLNALFGSWGVSATQAIIPFAAGTQVLVPISVNAQGQPVVMPGGIMTAGVVADAGGVNIGTTRVVLTVGGAAWTVDAPNPYITVVQQPDTAHALPAAAP
jgi:hypothetical protein